MNGRNKFRRQDTGSMLILDRIFLAGDAAHTHSPKAGQGMNVSIQDTYNLIWKLASVVTGIADQTILETYDSERRPVAEELMEMDHRLVHAYQKGGSTLDEVEQVRSKYAGFISGVQVTYPPSALVSSGDVNAAKRVSLGMRLPSLPVIRQADAACRQLAETLVSDGSWKLIVFPGDLRRPDRLDVLNAFADAFSTRPHLLATTRAKISSAIGMVLVHSSPRASVNLLDLPEAFRPFDDALGYDYWKVFADDSAYGNESGQAYKRYGIHESRGCLVLCRPDQHVAWIGGMEELAELDNFFGRFSRKIGEMQSMPER